ncbi:tRNA-splicing ligase RtcB, putative [Hepatocystis sp. ex Piliocolobus tephrosceles]|nr:tRNA-splicing ligase RtcB, putative [Hepatocystis sp. ex Piliocolobus tephrosceles]
MLRLCYIKKENIIWSVKKKISIFRNTKHGFKNTCYVNNKNIENFYNIPKYRFEDNESLSVNNVFLDSSPPYLLSFNNTNDILTFTKDIESDCLEQIKDLAKLNIIKGHVTILPDVHLGKGIIIGSVFLTKDFIIPNGVGVDIGCGILCVQINNLKKKNLTDKNINNIYEKIKKNIPLSFDYHDKPLFDSENLLNNLLSTYASKNMKHLFKPKHIKQLGTLGGGNHFIELAYDDLSLVRGVDHETDNGLSLSDNSINIPNNNKRLDIIDTFNEIKIKNAKNDKKRNNVSNKQEICTYGYNDENKKNDDSDIYILIHSGSRNLGKSTAEYYDIIASEESQMKKNKLAYLDLKKENGKNYLKDMQLCLQYAKYNRIYMMKKIEQIIYDELKCTLNWNNCIDIHHNFCNKEYITYVDNCCIKKDYMYVTRKGATSSKKNELGIIPGNMKVGSYIVKGKGNILSYNSCSHGCGRIMSRKKAKQLILQDDFCNTMKGIRCDTNFKIRDEAPQAYKNLNEVLKNQESLIHIVKKLQPLINIKGF